MLATLLSTIGKASQEPVNVLRKATIAWMIVTDMISTARTAAVRTASGMRRFEAGSSTHNCRGTRAPSAASGRAAADAAAPPRSCVLKVFNSPPLSDFRVAARLAPVLRGRNMSVLPRATPPCAYPVHMDEPPVPKIPQEKHAQGTEGHGAKNSSQLIRAGPEESGRCPLSLSRISSPGIPGQLMIKFRLDG
ncbi:hypothetical protein GCM10010221_38960 [Streptomyces parvus]|nr:hypothetical protein GCM10010221_38960 [Streptomyces parvus]